MKRITQAFATSALLVFPLVSQAGPKSCYAELSPPGAWSETQIDGRQTTEIGEGTTYRIRMAGPCWIETDNTGAWDWILHYCQASIWLTNSPGTAWYSETDTNTGFELSIPTMTAKLRNPEGQTTDYYSRYLEMEISAHAGNLVFLAVSAGIPTVTHVPETPDTIAYTVATLPLQSARLGLAPTQGPSTAPSLTIRTLQFDSPIIGLYWQSSTNGLTQLQYSQDLSDAFWTDLGSPAVESGMSHEVAIKISPGVSNAFFRILRFP